MDDCPQMLQAIDRMGEPPDAARAKAFQRHAESCPLCRRDLQSMEVLAGALGRMRPPAAVPPHDGHTSDLGIATVATRGFRRAGEEVQVAHLARCGWCIHLLAGVLNRLDEIDHVLGAGRREPETTDAERQGFFASLLAVRGSPKRLATLAAALLSYLTQCAAIALALERTVTWFLIAPGATVGYAPGWWTLGIAPRSVAEVVALDAACLGVSVLARFLAGRLYRAATETPGSREGS